MLQKSMDSINNLCGPAYLYFIFSCVSIGLTLIFSVFSKKNIPFKSILIRIIGTFLFTWLLSWLCEKGFTNFSWFLLYFLYIMVIILTIGTFITINNILKSNCGALVKLLDIKKIND
jgi:branched-subunit amino acid ABC-type transport system permease component